ncbi:hypothetical protein BDB00DRAFT_388308 [Zychaea mexicana]|uniref:uncharacterized protein n=1 Tax=Zychaea mexicana TaxID=64656 RepID=UPI0022FEA6AC|nr:uncharacterized protein BDB00DRAFT_274750 [Zychaea mexicana]XP_052979449.1 uncharacterized protein BDB00DRAFT_388308 [Zychaea mexicana]KAI9468535.1 hypothetical protein BDB00DRAFT_274750 [Zychaea mexicana]KAI9493184.1 hypothetical protein BDB00DRAFT_388308 [Zychaea mexicana]
MNKVYSQTTARAPLPTQAHAYQQHRNPNPHSTLNSIIFMIVKNNDISLASINCNKLLTLNKTQLVRHIKQQQPHIITMQETHISTPSQKDKFHRYFNHSGHIIAASYHLAPTSVSHQSQYSITLNIFSLKSNTTNDFFSLFIYLPSMHQQRRQPNDGNFSHPSTTQPS